MTHLLYFFQALNCTINKNNMFSTCNHHYNKRLSHFCQKHDEVICAKCIPESHEECQNVQPIEKAADTAKFGYALSSLETRIQNLKLIVTDMLRVNADNFSTLNDQKQTVKKKIKQIRSGINAYLEKLENELGNDLMEKYKVCVKEIDKERQIYLQQKENLDDWTREIKAMKNHASSVHLFSMAKLLHPKQKANEDSVQKRLADSKTSNIEFEQSRILLDFKRLVMSYGKISIRESPALMSSAHRKAFVIPSLLSRNDKPPSPVVSKFETSVFGNNVDVVRGCFLPDDRLFIPDSKSKIIYVCKINGANIKKIKLRHIPKDACVLDRSHALVTCGDSGIMMVDLRTLSPGTMIIPGGHCSAISCNKDKIFVVNDECKVSVIDLKGKVLKQITTRYDPYMITSNKTGVIFWTNYNNNNVNSILPNGTSQNVYSGSDLRESTGIATDNRGNVYVAGCDSSNIISVSRTDKSSKTLYAKRDGISSPLGIALSTDKSKLMVINNKQIRVYRTHSN